MRAASTTTRTLAMLALGGFLMVGCGSSDDPEETTTTQVQATPPQDTAPTTTEPVSDDVETTTAPPVDESPTTDAPPSSAELEDEGQEAAGQAVVDFWEVVDALAQDPDLPVQDLAKVAGGQAVTQWVSNTQSRRDSGQVQTGASTVSVTGVETIEEGERYEVTVCLDWSEIKVDGEKPDRGELGDRGRATYVVESDLVSEGELFVTEDPMEYEPCDP